MLEWNKAVPQCERFLAIPDSSSSSKAPVSLKPKPTHLIFHSLSSIKPLMNLPDQCDLSASFSKPNYLHKARCEGNPGGKHGSYQPWQIPVVSCAWPPLPAALCSIFLCAALPLRILLPSTYLACTGRLTLKCNSLLLERQILSELLHQFTKFTKECVGKTNQAFGCREIQASFHTLGGSLQRGGQMWPPSQCCSLLSMAVERNPWKR